MKPKTDRNRILADYLYNDLDPDERDVLEREIKKNPELYESYQLNIEVRDYLQAKIQLEEMKSDPQLENAEQLADMAFDVESHDKVERETIPIGNRKKRIRNIIFAAAIAATVAIVISVGIIPFSIDQDRLFDLYYEPIEASDFSQRGSNDMYRDIAMGINSYSDGNYQQSIDQFSSLASDPTLGSEVQFFTALSHLGLGQYQHAQSILVSVLDGDIRYQAETLWYLGLCCLKTGELEKASAFLGQLEIYDGMYKQDAQALRKKLRRFI